MDLYRELCDAAGALNVLVGDPMGTSPLSLWMSP